MVSQTSVNGQRIDETAVAVGENVANLASDLISLTELQVKLAVLDLKETSAQAVAPAAVLGAGICICLGTIPVLLLGISWALAHLTGVSPEAAMLIVSIVALLTAGISMALAYSRMVKSFRVLDRSREEFEANLNWIKKALQQSSSTRTWR